MELPDFILLHVISAAKRKVVKEDRPSKSQADKIWMKQYAEYHSTFLLNDALAFTTLVYARIFTS